MDKVNLSKTFGVYMIRNAQNGKAYVGSTTKSFYKRWGRWRCDLKRNKANRHLQSAWNKYGAENFEFSILEIVEDKEQVLEREQYWLDLLQSYDSTKGYNFAKKAKSERTGTTCSEETRAKMSLAKIGKRHTEEAKANMSKARKGISTGPSPKKGIYTVDKRCPVCGAQCKRNLFGAINKTCGEKECIWFKHKKGTLLGYRSPHSCPECGKPRKECYTSKGKFTKYQITCGDPKCISIRKHRWRSKRLV